MSTLLIESSVRPARVGLAHEDGRIQTGEGQAPAESVEGLVRDWARVSRFGLSIGPGSFTGLRVGLSLLKGLAFVHPRPVAPISSLRVWAASVDAPAVAAVLDARRERVFMALYEGDRCLIPEAARPLAEARALLEGRDCVLVGDGVEQLSLMLPKAQGVTRPSLRALARLVRSAPEEALRSPSELEPRYLLRTEIEEQLDPDGRGN
ncbi:MAG: tRNA (adenosine(37)-N6)-threonylcarbamoyltransferase complex dimerization subunit type 1 TsaB [Myxococcota bacterium]